MHLYTDVPAFCFNYRIICFCSHDSYGIGLHEIRLEILPHAAFDVFLGTYLVWLGDYCRDYEGIDHSFMLSLFFELIRVSVGKQVVSTQLRLKNRCCSFAADFKHYR